MPKFFNPDQGRSFLTRLNRAFPWAGTHEGYEHWAALHAAVNDRLGLGMAQQDPDHTGTDKSVMQGLYDAIAGVAYDEQPEGPDFWAQRRIRISDIRKVLEDGYLKGDVAKAKRRELAGGRDADEVESEIYASTPFDHDQSRFCVAFLKHLDAVAAKAPKAAPQVASLDLIGLIRAAVVQGLVTREELPGLVREHAKVAVHAVEVSIKDGPAVLLEDGPYHKVFPTVLQGVAARCNVALVGPAGAGKTTLANQVANALGLPFLFTGAIQSEFKLLGFLDANSGYRPTAFRQAYEHGGVFLFDEVDASAPQTLLAFNAALANGECDFPDGTVKRHRDFVAIAAANTFWNGRDRVYVGRNQLDAATMDRFVFMEMDYDEALEAAVATNAAWTGYVQAARKAARELQVRHVISPRASIAGSKLLEQGIDGQAVATMTLWKGLPETEIRKIATKMPDNGEVPTALRRAPTGETPATAIQRVTRKGMNLLDAMRAA